MLNRAIAIVLAAVVATGGVVGYWSYYEARLPGTLVMHISALWPESPNPQVIGIYITIVRVEVHIAGEGNQTGWRAIVEDSQTVSLNPTGLDSSMQSSKLAIGSYDLLRFNVTEIVMDVQNTGNVTYLVRAGWFVPPLGAERRDPNGLDYPTVGFKILAGSLVSAEISLALVNYQNIAENGYIKPAGYVSVFA